MLFAWRNKRDKGEETFSVFNKQKNISLEMEEDS